MQLTCICKSAPQLEFGIENEVVRREAIRVRCRAYFHSFFS
jgi:hypothetical protein